MNSAVTWLETHESLSGWVQFLGAMLALIVTYLTAFAPHRRRKRQLASASVRLLSHGYEAIESYHRTSAKFLPFPLSIRFASLTMVAMAREIDKFPIYELDDHGSNSIARRLVTMGTMLSGLSLMLEDYAKDLDGRDATEEDQLAIRQFVGERLEAAKDLLTGAPLKPPVWPPQPTI